MAEKNQGGKGTTAPATGNKPTPPTATTPTAPPTEAPKEKKEKKERAKYQEHFDTAEAASEAAASRTKGPRKAFKVVFGDKTFYVVHNNEGRALGSALAKMGGTAEEIGKAPKKTKALGFEGVMAAIQALPEGEREAVLKAMTGAK